MIILFFFLGNFYYHPNRLFWPISFYADFLRENFRIYFFNDTHRQGLVFHSIQYRNGCLAASDLSPMFTQSIKFYTFHYQYRCLKNVIHQIEKWMVAPFS